jgi:hypothetical protein
MKEYMVTITDSVNAQAEEQEELLRQKLQIMSGLQSGVIEVKFVKKDGTDRTMLCTLNDKYLPQSEEIDEETAKRNKSEEYVAVWDLDKEGWRSFRFNSVTGYTIGVDYD